MSMQELNLPSFEFRLQKADGQVRIFDVIRKKFVVLSPEEWVRQHFIHYLIEHKRVPAGLIVLEKTITLNTMSRRPDILIHDRKGKAVMVIECKAPEVKVSQAAFDQVARYNAVLRVPYLVVTNGLEHYCCRMEFALNTYTFLQEIPDYSSMTGVQG